MISLEIFTPSTIFPPMAAAPHLSKAYGPSSASFPPAQQFPTAQLRASWATSSIHALWARPMARTRLPSSFPVTG